MTNPAGLELKQAGTWGAQAERSRNSLLFGLAAQGLEFGLAA